jgi:hypothetical protein
MTGVHQRWLSAGGILTLVGAMGLTITGQAPPNKFDNWLMNGAATTACETLTSQLRSDRSRWGGYYRNAGMSFLTGANFHAGLTRTGNPQVGANTAPAALLAAVELYCGSHPLANFGLALKDVYIQLLTE